ncbi:MAG: PaaI family thioesterase [Gemmataceae bacterium]
MTTMLDAGRQMIRGEREHFPAARLIGLTMTELDPGRAAFTLAVDQRHHNPLGTLHGGITTDLADSAMGWAYAATLAEGDSFTTVELKVNFLRPVRSGLLTAVATVVKAGSTLGYVECEVKDEAGKLVAKAASTCLRLKAADIR